MTFDSRLICEENPKKTRLCKRKRGYKAQDMAASIIGIFFAFYQFIVRQQF
jgi:hypothetical protein